MKKSLLKVIAVVLAFILVGCGSTKETNTETTVELPRLMWPQNELAELIPIPSSQFGEVELSIKDQISILVMQTSGEDYYAYVTNCAENGFNNVEIESTTEYKATNADGYRLALSYDGENEMRIVVRQPLRKINITVDCAFNLLFNKYDVNLYWDGVEQGTIPHGETADFHITVDDGTYTVEFKKVGQTSPNGTATIDICEDADITFNISCGGDDITIEQEYISMRPLTENEVRMPVPYTDFLHEHYENISVKLSELGFTNIKTIALYDIYWGITDEGDVGEISINGVSDFLQGAIFAKDDEVIITYHMAEEDDPSRISMVKNSSEYVGLNYTYVEQELKELGFTNIVYEDEVTTNTCYHTGEVVEVEIKYGEFESGESFMPNEEIAITRYKVDSVDEKPTITMTVDGASFVGMHYTEAEAKIREMGFMNIEYRERITYDSEVIPETIDFVEIDYNLDHRIGEMFNADAEVVLVYWKYEEFKSDYELAFVRRMQNYSIYYMFDTDAKKVAFFYTDDIGVSYASYWGDFSSGITINWTNGQGQEKFTYKGSGSDAILTDANGNTWEYVETDLITAQERLDDRK